MKSTSVRMTEGPIFKQLLLFSLPMLLGNLFQQTYNMVDSIIVGKFVGDAALAAVGSSANMIHLVLSVFFGLSMGAGVVVARAYGARDQEGLYRSIHTMLTFGLIGGAVLTAVGLLLTPSILGWIGTPASVKPLAASYFRIYFCGTLFSTLYNFCGGIMRATGDSRRPLIYLIASCLVNTVLDLLFVAVLGWGVEGAAFATILSQLISCALCLYTLFFGEVPCRVQLRGLRLERKTLFEIISVGLPSGFQSASISLSNLLIQSSVNFFGETALAGYGAYCKIEGFALMPASAFAMACTTFVSQNIGAGRLDRVKKGAVAGLALNMATSEFFGLLLYFFSPIVLRAFTDSPAVIAAGVAQARTVALFYCLCGATHALTGILRGSGQSRFPMLVTLVFWCGLRIVWVSWLVPLYPVVGTLFKVYPISWICSFSILAIYLLRSRWPNGAASQTPFKSKADLQK